MQRILFTVYAPSSLVLSTKKQHKFYYVKKFLKLIRIFGDVFFQLYKISRARIKKPHVSAYVAQFLYLWGTTLRNEVWFNKLSFTEYLYSYYFVATQKLL